MSATQKHLTRKTHKRGDCTSGKMLQNTEKEQKRKKKRDFCSLLTTQHRHRS